MSLTLDTPGCRRERCWLVALSTCGCHLTRAFISLLIQFGSNRSNLGGSWVQWLEPEGLVHDF